MHKCTYFSSRSFSLLCVLLGAMRRGMFTPANISNYGLQSHEMLWNWGKIKCICLRWWQVARVTNPRLINNSLQWSLLSSAQWRVHHPSGHRGNYSLQRIRIYIKARINECTNIYGVTSNVQYKAHALLQNWTSFRYSWGVEEDQNTVSIQSLGTFLRISSGLSHSRLPFCFATSATRIGKTPK